MSDSLLSGVKLAAIAAAAALLFRDAAAFSLPGGLTLLLVLFAFDVAAKSFFQSVAFAAVGGFALTVALLPVVPYFFGSLQLGVPLVYPVWIVGTVLILLLDRSRNGGSVPAPYQQAYSFAPTAPPPVSSAPSPPPQGEATTPAAVRETPVQRPAPAPTFAAAERVEPRLVRDEPVAPPAPVSTPIAPPAPQAVALKGGKQTDIYVNLMDEGMAMLRSVKAEHVGRDFYHIIDVMPPNERWQFGPGQVVRCQKKNLSSGKALVAFEEAPRAQ